MPFSEMIFCRLQMAELWRKGALDAPDMDRTLHRMWYLALEVEAEHPNQNLSHSNLHRINRPDSTIY